MQSGRLDASSSSANCRWRCRWMDLPGIARYEMEFALYGPQQRVTSELSLAVPSQRAGDRRAHRG